MADLSDNYADPRIAELQRTIVNSELEQFYAGNIPEFFKRAGEAMQWIQARVGLDKATVLDIACGSGYYSEVFDRLVPGWVEYTGMDYNPGMVWMGRRHYPHLEIQQGNILDIPFPDNSFDIVFSSATIAHVEDWRRAISELARVSKRWIVLHRTPIHLDWNTVTSPIVRQDYGVDVLVYRFNTRELDMFCMCIGLKLMETLVVGTDRQDDPSDHLGLEIGIGTRCFILEKRAALVQDRQEEGE